MEQVTWQNALDAYGQSGQIDREALLRTPSIDQTQLFEDNSVLRGQAGLEGLGDRELAVAIEQQQLGR